MSSMLYKCICGKHFNLYNFGIHKNLCTFKKCSQCFKVYASEDFLNEHECVPPENVPTVYQCFQCSRSDFDSTESLVGHECSAPGVNVPSLFSHYQCFQCLGQFESVQAMTAHHCLNPTVQEEQESQKEVLLHNSDACVKEALRKNQAVAVCPFCHTPKVTRQMDKHIRRHAAVKEFIKDGSFYQGNGFSTPQEYAKQMKSIAMKVHILAEAEVLNISNRDICVIAMFIPDKKSPMGFASKAQYIAMTTVDGYEGAIEKAKNKLDRYIDKAASKYPDLNY